MGFLPMPDELDTRPILADLLAAGKRVYVPRTFVRERRMIPVRLADLGKLRGASTTSSSRRRTRRARRTRWISSSSPAGRSTGTATASAVAQDSTTSSWRNRGFRAVRCGVAFACQVLPKFPR